MVKRLLYTMAITTLVGLFFSFEAKAQCGDELVDICHAELGDARFIRDFPVQHSGSDQSSSPRVTSYDITLSAGTTYRILTCNDQTKPGKVIVSLYRGDQLIATNFDMDSGRFFPYVEYPVSASGRYRLTFTFKDGEEGCAVGILAAVED